MLSFLLCIVICWTFMERVQRDILKIFWAGSDVTHCFSLDFWRDKFKESFKLSLSRRSINYIICTGSNDETFKRYNKMTWRKQYFYFMTQWPPNGPGPPHYRGLTIIFRHYTLCRTPLGAETSTWQHTTFTRHRHPCPRRDSKPQTHALDHADTGIGQKM